MASLKTILFNSALAGLTLAHSPNGKRATIPADGTIIASCRVPGTVALTFDDGPFIYTQEVVNQLTAAGHRATFFQNGQNYDSIYNYQATLQSMIAGGHQIGSHTWNHADLTTLDAAGITSEMQTLETAHLALVGLAPTYMRPPYFSTNAFVLSTLAGLGYKVIQADIDTLDWQNDPAGRVQDSINIYESGQSAGGTISLNHDTLQPTAETFVPAIIQYLASKGLRSVPVGECLGDDRVNWYRNGGTPPTNPPPPTNPGGVLSPDFTCGGINGYVCASGSCCSQYGWCGTSSDYCAAGCQPAFGTCSGNIGGGSTGGGSTGGSVDPIGGTCGGGSGHVCGTGACCSQWGYCGISADYCGAGCQAAFGACQ
jgi:peptidoglycan/xylan/chitin deacetylase (PgdA/CDA1 family)